MYKNCVHVKFQIETEINLMYKLSEDGVKMNVNLNKEMKYIFHFDSLSISKIFPAQRFLLHAATIALVSNSKQRKKQTNGRSTELINISMLRP